MTKFLRGTLPFIAAILISANALGQCVLPNNPTITAKKGNSSFSNADSICNAETITFSYPAAHCSTFAYAWQYSVAKNTPVWVTAADSIVNPRANNSPYKGGTPYLIRLKIDSLDGGVIAGTAYSQSFKFYVGRNLDSAAALTSYSSPCSGGKAQFVLSGATSPNFTYYLYNGTTLISSAPGKANGITLETGVLNSTTSSSFSATYNIKARSSGDPRCEVSVATNLAITVAQLIDNNTISATTTGFCGSANISITGSAGTGGSGTRTYYWEFNDGGNWSHLAADTFQNLSSRTITKTTDFRRTLSSKGCPSLTNTTSSLTITITPAITGNTVSNDQTLCSGESPKALTVGTASGGVAAKSYQWQRKNTKAANWTDIASANSAGFTPPSLVNKSNSDSVIEYRRIVISGFCQDISSTTATITFNPAINSNTLSKSGTTCSDELYGQITGSAPKGGGTFVSYQWQSTDSANVNFKNISGATSQNYTPGLLTKTTLFRREYITATCRAFSDTVTVSVVTAPTKNDLSWTVNSKPVTVFTICSGQTPDALVTGKVQNGTGTYAYQWDSSTNGSNFMASKIKTETFPFGPQTKSGFYRRVVTSGPCISTSNAVEVIVLPVITKKTLTAPDPICLGQDADKILGSTPVGGNIASATPKYKWQSSLAENGPYTDIPNATSIDYDPGKLTTSTWYRRKVESAPCEDFSAPIQVVVYDAITNNELYFGTSSSKKFTTTICYNQVPDMPTTTDPDGGSGNPSFIWESSPDGKTNWTSLNNAKKDFTPGKLTSTVYYRRIVSKGPCAGAEKSTSNTLEVIVLPKLEDGEIQGDDVICKGQAPKAITVKTAVKGGDSKTYPYTYRWETRIKGAKDWTPIPGATKDNYQPGVLDSAATHQFQRITEGGPCAGTEGLVSNTVEVKVWPSIQFNILQGDQSICAGQAPKNPIVSGSGQKLKGGNGTYMYEWESSPDGTAFTKIPGATQETYTVPALTSTMYYRRIVRSGECDGNQNSTSNTIRIIIQPQLKGYNIASATPYVCRGDAPAPITSSQTITGGNGVYQYQWEYRIGSGPWTPLDKETKESFSPGPISQPTTFRRTVTSGDCIGTDAVMATYTIDTAHIPFAPKVDNPVRTVCSNQNGVPFYFDQIEPGIDYSWFTNSPGVYLSKFDTTFTTAYFEFANTVNTILAIATNPNTGCADTTIVTVNVSNDYAYDDQKIEEIPRKAKPGALTLICTDANAVAYQWGFDDLGNGRSTPLPGETTQLLYLETGIATGRVYWVETKRFYDEDACWTRSYHNYPTALAKPGSFAIGIAPNPIIDHRLNLLADKFIGQGAEFSILTANGQIIMKTSMALAHNMSIPLPPSLPPGLYLLRCVAGQQFSVSTFVIK